VVTRRGASTLGCLVPLLLLALVVYFAIDFGEAYFHAYQFEDSMRSDAQFASTLTDDKIRSHLAALADTLGLPSDAQQITINRSTSTISISTDYDEVIKLPFNKERVLHFHPSVASNL
jgi:hypothetical protein